MQAFFNGAVIADSDDTVGVGGRQPLLPPGIPATTT